MRLLCLASLCLALVSCGADAPLMPSPEGSEGTATESKTPPPTTRPSPSPSVSAEPEGTAPPELAGTWRRAYEGELLRLTLDGNGYTVQAAGGVGAGRIFVEGDRITFSNSNRCDGTGTYTWGFENERLRFTLVGDDPCGRVDFLLRATFGRVDP